MFEIVEIKKQVANLWKKFDDLTNQIPEEDYEYFEKKSKYVKDTLEFEAMNEMEFNGSMENYLDYPKAILEKAIQEIIDFYHRG